MPTGTIRHLRKVQLGKEATKKTAVAATEQLQAEAEITPQYERFRNEHPIGVLVDNAGASARVREDVEVLLRMNGATYEQLPWLLSLSLDQPVTTGAGPYVHTWDPGVAAIWNPHSATLEGRWTDGVTPEDLEVNGVSGSSLRLSIEQNGALNAELRGFGVEMKDEAITSLSLPGTPAPIIAAHAKVFINDTWAAADAQAPASGVVSNQILSAEFEVDVGQFGWHGVDGALTYQEAKERQKGIRGTVRMLYNPAGGSEGAAAERVHAKAGDLRFVTLAFTGPGNMQFYVAMTLQHEMDELPPPVGEQDGLDVVEMPFVSYHDATGAKLVKAVIQNDDADPL